jgi:chorismate mutase
MNKKTEKEFALLRKQIDQADKTLFSALGSRARAVEKLGVIKRDYDLPVFQKKRWKEVLRERVKIAKGIGLSENFSRKLLELIHKESCRVQRNIKRGKKS